MLAVSWKYRISESPTVVLGSDLLLGVLWGNEPNSEMELRRWKSSLVGLS